MNILVTGGAGYIGSIAVKKLVEQGHNVIVIDNLSKGKKELVHEQAQFFEADLVNKEAVFSVFAQQSIDVVMHFAAYKAAEESMENPEKYQDNITGTQHILAAMVKHNVSRIIYSSTAAVYGEPEYTPLDEEHPTIPVNFYGYTKLVGEQLVEWYAHLHNISYCTLRYFNVVGDGGLNYLDPQPRNVLPIIMEVLSGKQAQFHILGTDYDTRDGTCIRDYIDVNDLVDAHVLALEKKDNSIINLGTEQGTSVKELVTAIEEVSQKTINKTEGPRREGDAPLLVASNQLAHQLLNWHPNVSLKESIASTLKAYQP